MNLLKYLFILCFALSSSLKAQEGLSNLTPMTPLSKDFLSQAYYANSPRTQIYLAAQTLPAYNFSSVWRAGAVWKNAHRNIALGLHSAGLSFGPYQEYTLGLLLRKEFTEEFAAWMRPSYSVVGVTAYGKRGYLGGDVGIRYTNKAWSLAACLEKTSFQKDTKSSLLFAWSYRLTERYQVNIFIQNARMLPIRYGAELTFTKGEKQLLVLGLASSMHLYLRYQCQGRGHQLLLGFHYSSIWGLAPDNAYSYAW